MNQTWNIPLFFSPLPSVFHVSDPGPPVLSPHHLQMREKPTRGEMRCDESYLTGRLRADLMDWITDWLTNLLYRLTGWVTERRVGLPPGSCIIHPLSFYGLNSDWRTTAQTQITFLDWMTFPLKWLRDCLTGWLSAWWYVQVLHQ